jgi:hypothetical protein
MSDEYNVGELLMTTCELLERPDGSTCSADELEGKVPFAWLSGRARMLPTKTYISYMSFDENDENNVIVAVAPLGRILTINKKHIIKVDDAITQIENLDYE